MSFQTTVGVGGKLDIMALFGLGLSRMDRETRAFYMGGSDSNIAVGNDLDRIYHLIGVKRGELEPENLEDNVAVQLGILTEPYNALKYEQVTGIRVTSRNATIDHPSIPYYRASVDGIVENHPDYGRAVWEAKYTSATNIDTVVKTYNGQLQANMQCCGTQWAILSVILGGRKFVHTAVPRDDEYIAAMRARTDMVWRAVESETGLLEGRLPDMPKTVFAPDPVDLTKLPNANEIADLMETVLDLTEKVKELDAAKEAARDALKQILPQGVAEGHGAQGFFKRNAKGDWRFGRLKAANDDDLTY